jgi:pimeloyl-ACP methyl ester carboxylesterase
VQAEAPPLDPRELTLPVAFIRGGDSEVTPPAQMDVTRDYLPGASFLELPASGHHMMIDQPLALIAMLRGLFADERPEEGKAWRLSTKGARVGAKG